MKVEMNENQFGNPYMTPTHVEAVEAWKNRYPLDKPVSHSLFWRDCPTFVVQTSVLGTALGFTVGGMIYAHQGQKYHHTLLEDISAPRGKPSAPLHVSRSQFIAQNTFRLLSYTMRGTLHGALYGATNCFLRKADYSDRAAVFGSGLVFTALGPILWPGKSWVRYGLTFTLFSTLFTFNNDAMTIDEANLTEQQATRARQRLEDRTEFLQERLRENTMYKHDYFRANPEQRVQKNNYEFYA